MNMKISPRKHQAMERTRVLTPNARPGALDVRHARCGKVLPSSKAKMTRPVAITNRGWNKFYA